MNDTFSPAPTAHEEASASGETDRKRMRLFHGTTRSRAKSILANGFRLPARPSYVGKAVCLTPDVSQAYEYGALEDGGVVLECRLKADAQTCTPPSGYKSNPSDDLGKHCHSHRVDATWAWSMWVVSNPLVIEIVGIVPHATVVRMLTEEFNRNGPHVAYNGRTADYAELWWDEHPASCEYDQLVVQRLKRNSDYAAHLAALRVTSTPHACVPN